MASTSVGAGLASSATSAGAGSNAGSMQGTAAGSKRPLDDAGSAQQHPAKRAMAPHSTPSASTSAVHLRLIETLVNSLDHLPDTDSSDDDTSSSGLESDDEMSGDASSDDSSSDEESEEEEVKPKLGTRRKPQTWNEIFMANRSEFETFLVKMALANEDLEHERRNGTLEKRNIESVEEGARHVEMNLGLGVLEEKGEGTNSEDSGSDEDEEGDGDTNRVSKLMGNAANDAITPGIEVMRNMTG